MSLLPEVVVSSKADFAGRSVDDFGLLHLGANHLRARIGGQTILSYCQVTRLGMGRLTETAHDEPTATIATLRELEGFRSPAKMARRLQSVAGWQRRMDRTV